MNASQLCNEPVAFSAGGQVLRFRRLSAFRLDAVKQAVFTAKLYADIARALDALPAEGGPVARSEKARELREAMPVGFAFVLAAEEFFAAHGTELLRLLAEANADGFQEEQIGRALRNATQGEKDAIFMHVLYSRRQVAWTDGDIQFAARYMAREYGFTPKQIAELSDDQLFDLTPGLVEAHRSKVAAEAIAKQKAAEAATKPETPNA